MIWFLDLFGGFVIWGAVIGGALSLGTWLTNFFRKRNIENRYVAFLQKKLEQQKLMVIDRLRQKLKEYSKVEDLAKFAQQGEAQFGKAREKYERFKEILGRKLNPSEITYGRFLGTVEQLYLSILDNLETIVTSLDIMNGVDLHYIDDRMNYLDGLDHPEPADEDEKSTLADRQALREKHRAKVNQLLTIDEQAMTQIDASMSAVAEANTVAGRASLDMETARDELVELIERTKQFTV